MNVYANDRAEMDADPSTESWLYRSEGFIEEGRLRESVRLMTAVFDRYPNGAGEFTLALALADLVRASVRSVSVANVLDVAVVGDWTLVESADGNGAASAVSLSLAITVAQASGGSGSDTLISIENLTGSTQADSLTGDGGANLLIGGGGHDLLDGREGAALVGTRPLPQGFAVGPRGRHVGPQQVDGKAPAPISARRLAVLALMMEQQERWLTAALALPSQIGRAHV